MYAALSLKGCQPQGDTLEQAIANIKSRSSFIWRPFPLMNEMFC